MAWSLYHTFTPTGTVAAGAAGSTLQDSNVDVTGNIWSIASGVLAAGGSPAYNASHLTRPSSENKADQRIVLTITGLSGTPDYGIVLRRADASNFYFFRWNSAGALIYKIVAGGLAQVGTTQSYVYTTGHNYTFDCSIQGTSLNITITDVTASTTPVNYTVTDTALSAAGQYALGAAAVNGNITKVDYYNITGGSFTVSPPNGAATLPSNHNANISVALVGTGTAFVNGTTTMTASGVAGWSVVSTTVTDGTHATVVLSGPAVASPPAGATGTLTLTEGGTGTATGTITVATPTLTLTPSSVGQSGTTSLYATGANTLWQGDNPQLTASALTGSSIGASSQVDNTHTVATFTSGTTAGTSTITDPSTGAQATLTVLAATGVIPVNNANVVFEPGWYLNGSGFARTTRGNNAVRFGWTASASGAISLVYSSGTAGVPAVKYILDNAAPVTLAVGANQTNATISIATALSAANHQLVIYTSNENDSVDDWGVSNANGTTTLPGSFIQFNYFTIDSGQTTVAPATPKKTNKLFADGDSITYGSGIASDATFGVYWSWPRLLASALAALNGGYEVAIQGDPSQGWAGPSALASNIPHYHTTGTPAQSRWRWYYAGLARSLPNGANDIIVVNHGYNDSGVADATLTALINDWLTQIRITAPNPWIFLVVPFANIKRAAITAVTLPDSKCKVVDLDPNSNDSSRGYPGSGSSFRASDGIHPNQGDNGEKAARIAQAIMNFIQPGSGGGVPRRFQ